MGSNNNVSPSSDEKHQWARQFIGIEKLYLYGNLSVVWHTNKITLPKSMVLFFISILIYYNSCFEIHFLFSPFFIFCKRHGWNGKQLWTGRFVKFTRTCSTFFHAQVNLPDLNRYPQSLLSNRASDLVHPYHFAFP